MISKMENEANAPDLYDRKFGHYNIIWKIENFRIASCEENWNVQSPVLRIDGHQMTRWMMILSPKVKKDKCYAVLSLKRLKTDKGPDVVWVQWRSWIKLIESNNEEKEYYLSEYEHRFKKGEVFASDHLLLNQLYFYVKPFIHDVFKIRCLFVFQPEYKDVPVTNVPAGVNSLSEALSSLHDFAIDYDIVLNTNLLNIRAHKAILHYRNNIFAEKIENCKNGVMDLWDAEYEALYNIIYYLYTGNLEFILHRPTIAVEELALDFHIDEIKNCYILNTLFLESKYDIYVFSFEWRIPNYSTRNQLYRASPIISGGLNFSWRLYIFPNTLAPESVEYAAICFAFVNGKKPRKLCIEFAVLDNRNQCIHSKRKCKKLGDAIGFENFMKKEDLRAALVNDALRIRFRVIVSPSSVWSSSEWYDNDLRPTVKIDPYVKLSSDLAHMFREGKFGDITIQAEGQSFKAHQCILTTRSSVLTEMLRDYNVTIPNMKSRILQMLLYYMYTGILKDYNLKDIYMIYNHSVTYNISTLPEICSNILKDNLNVQSVVDILIFSAEKKDRPLKQSAIEFISQNKNRVFEDDSWQNLTKVKPSLCQEVATYMKNKNKKYLTFRKRFLLFFKRK